MRKGLIAGVAVIAIAAVGLTFLLPHNDANGSSQVTKAKNVEVEAAFLADDLKAGEFFSSRNIVWRVTDSQNIDDGVIIKSSRNNNLDGALVLTDLKQGTALKSDDFILKDDPDFIAAVLKKGMRAFTIQVDNVTGGAGLLRPGNRVDVILSGKFGLGGEGSRAYQSAQTILSDLRVIAVNKTIEPTGFRQEENQDRRNTANENRSNKGTVTLEVSPKDVEVLTVARNAGQLSLSLRDLHDDAVANDNLKSVTTVAEVVPIPVIAAQKGKADVKTFYGTSSEPAVR